MKLSDHMISNKATQELRLNGSQSPVPPSAIETEPNPTIVLALNDIAIRMFETHRTHADHSDFRTTRSELPQPNDRGEPPETGDSDNPALTDIPVDWKGRMSPTPARRSTGNRANINAPIARGYLALQT